jgi:hypothetical protein
MLYEDDWLDLRGSSCQELVGNPQGLTINEFCYRQLQVLLVGGVYAGEN